MKQTAQVKAFFDTQTNTFSYVVSDPDTQRCAVVDSVLDYDAASATTKTEQADLIIAYIQKNSLSVDWILETHVHADHLSAAQYLKQKLGGKIAISHKIEIVQQTFGEIYHLDIKSLNAKQSFDYLFADYETFLIGNIEAYNIPTPGHTPACLSYVIGDAVFVGDTLFMPDYGTARCDFPKGSAAALFDSVKTLYTLPDKRGCSYAMTTYPKVVINTNMKRRFIRKSMKTFISILQRKKLILSRCETAVMQR